jgi:hypothetical protein
MEIAVSLTVTKGNSFYYSHRCSGQCDDQAVAHYSTPLTCTDNRDSGVSLIWHLSPDVFHLLFSRICIVKSHMCHATVRFRHTEVEADRLGVSQVQISVRLYMGERRERRS